MNYLYSKNNKKHQYYKIKIKQSDHNCNKKLINSNIYLNKIKIIKLISFKLKTIIKIKLKKYKMIN